MALFPAQLTLGGSSLHSRIIACVVREGNVIGEVRKGLWATSHDEQVAVFAEGIVAAKGVGRTSLVFRCGSLRAELPIEVQNFNADASPSFRNDVQAVLAKANCNSGACHGALAGKAGFRLSLRGYDDEGDYTFITRQARGRRISLSEPHRSLLLTKPTGQVAHKGGVRLTVDSPEYEVVAAWLAAGAPGPSSQDARIQSIEVLPPMASVRPGIEMQLMVLGRFSDGSVKDLTSVSKFSSLQSSVASVDENGYVKVTGSGAGIITAWCLSQNGLSRIHSPFEGNVEASLVDLRQSENFIDELVAKQLSLLGVPASPRADDSVFVRRAFLDAVGALPTDEEAKAFLADVDPDKRAKLVDKLLGSPQFIDYWSYKFSDLLLVNSGNLGGSQAMWSYYQWIRDRVAANTPWDQFARELITATGSTTENGAANFFVLHEDPQTLAENTSMAFLGMSINCAKCHNHPLEKWTNDQYYAMANMFSRVRRKFDDRTGGTLIFSDVVGELIQPRTGKPQPPSPLDATPIDTESTEDRRVALAEWLTAPNNPYFSRAISNRVWANFMGRGLVEPVDDLRSTNPASNPQLFEALATYLRENKYDLRKLMRQIMLSETYQRSSSPVPGNVQDLSHYSHFYPRRMMAEVMLDAFSQVTGVPSQFADYPPTWRALQLPDSAVNSPFLSSFGRPKRELTCSCEREALPSMTQALHLANGDSLNRKLFAENQITQQFSEGADDVAILENLYWSALSRPASEREREKVLEELQKIAPAERRSAWEDVYWSLLTSDEFLFNH